MTFDNVWEAVNYFQWNVDNRGNGVASMGIEEQVRRLGDDKAEASFRTNGYGESFSLHDVVRKLLIHLNIEPIKNQHKEIEFREIPQEDEK